MAESGGRRTPSGRLVRVPSFPDDCSGLLAALQAAKAGSVAALREWLAANESRILEALRRAGLDAPVSRKLLDEILTAAFLAVEDGQTVRNEPGWLASMAYRLDLERCRQDARVREETDERPEKGPGPADQAECRDLLAAIRSRIEAACARLPPPYAQAILLQARGRSRAEIAEELRWLRPDLKVSENTVCGVLKKAHEMFRIAWNEGDPRSIWPERYGPKNPWTRTPPPPVLHSRCGRGSPEKDLVGVAMLRMTFGRRRSSSNLRALAGRSVWWHGAVLLLGMCAGAAPIAVVGCGRTVTLPPGLAASCTGVTVTVTALGAWNDGYSVTVTFPVGATSARASTNAAGAGYVPFPPGGPRAPGTPPTTSTIVTPPAGTSSAGLIMSWKDPTGAIIGYNRNYSF